MHGLSNIHELMELSSEEKWKVIKDGIDKYCKDFTEDAKVIINPINKDLVQGNYKGCIFEYDKRIEIDGFIIGPKSHTL